MRSWRVMANSLPLRRIGVNSKERPIFNLKHAFCGFSGVFSDFAKKAV